MFKHHWLPQDIDSYFPWFKAASPKHWKQIKEGRKSNSLNTTESKSTLDDYKISCEQSKIKVEPVQSTIDQIILDQYNPTSPDHISQAVPQMTRTLEDHNYCINSASESSERQRVSILHTDVIG